MAPRPDQPPRNDNQYPPSKGKFICQDPNNHQPKEFAGEQSIYFLESTPILKPEFMEDYLELAPGYFYLPSVDYHGDDTIKIQRRGYLLMYDYKRDIWLAISLRNFSITHEMIRDRPLDPQDRVGAFMPPDKRYKHEGLMKYREISLIGSLIFEEGKEW